MRKPIVLSFLFSLVSCFCFSQECIEQDVDQCVSVDFGSLSGNIGDTVCTSVAVCHFTNVLSFQFSIDYDETVVKYLACEEGDFANYNCSGVNEKDGFLNTLWFDAQAEPRSLDSMTTIANLCFEVISAIPSDSTMLQIGDQLSPEFSIGDPSDATYTLVLDKLCGMSDLTSNSINIEESGDISLFPNPARDELYIKTNSEKYQLIKAEIFDQSGKLVKVSWDLKEAIPLNDLSSSIYFIRLLDKNGITYSTSFVKE